MRRNRWNTIGRTRERLAELLTVYLNDPVWMVRPEDISAMRLAGKARLYEDAHSWEAWPSRVDDPNARRASLYSYANMTKCVKAGKLYSVGGDGEISP